MAFTWTQLIPGITHDTVSMATSAVVASGLVVAGVVARKQLGKGDAAVIPADRVSVRGFFEFITEFIKGLTDSVVGKEGRPFVPAFCTIFLFILINNLLGLFPGWAPATEHINMTVALGLFTFLYYNYRGIKEHGLSYFKHFLGPFLPIAFLMLPIELISHMLRPLTLGLRLANVMTGDHMIVGTFLDLAPVLVPIPFYLLGIFISFIQAFVFTLLSMAYVALAIAHDH